MPIKTTYTEAEVKDYMEAVMGDTASKLGWSAASGDFNEPVLEVLYLLERTDFSWVSTAAEANQVRTVARMEAWRAGMYYTAHEASYSAGAPGTGQTSRADIYRHCKEMFNYARADVEYKYPDLSPDSGGNEVKSYDVEYGGDYYGNADD